MPLQATSGAASYDAFGGGVPVVPNYIEDVFSTYLYTGNATTGQSINNGIDLATKGGLLWCKNRTTGSTPHYLFDTARDFSYSNAAVLNTASTAAQEDKGTDYAKPETNGFSFGSGAGSTSPNKSGDAFASWTFRKQPKFFDVITWTGNGAATQTISHNLGSAPGCIIAKVTSTTGNWFVYHRGTSGTPLQDYLRLNLTNAANASGSDLWGATSTTITVDSGLNLTTNGATYVAYVFAHDAGGFGLTGTDNVISCGSVVGASQVEVNLGYEPQWILVKNASAAQDWWLVDNMRGLPVQGTDTSYNASNLRPNLSDAETTGFAIAPSATGFKANVLTAGQTYIYIAIRRGPMKVPTDGTKVFSPLARTGTNAAATITGIGFPPDLIIGKVRDATFRPAFMDRLRGTSVALQSSVTDAEVGTTVAVTAFGQNGVSVGADSDIAFINYLTNQYASWFMRRAPSFFDEVCYLGTGADPQTVSHNLGVAPELMIFKARAVAAGWRVWGGNMAITEYLALSETSAVVTGSTFFGSTLPTATSFYVGSGLSVSARTHVAYLFATCAGVSKVFSYTGNGSSQTINCGFTGGARWILIKRTDSTGDWYVWDSARGIVSGNDPHLSLNTTAAEVTTDDTIDTDSTGFVVNQVSATNVNVSSATYIGLAIA